MEAVILDLPGNCLCAVVGLLNAGGGRLRLISMESRTPRQLWMELCEAILPSPSVYVECFTEEGDAGQATVIDVRAGAGKPYFLAKDGQETGAWRWPEAAAEPERIGPEELHTVIVKRDGPVYEEQRALCQRLTHDGLRQAMAQRGLPLGRPQRLTLGLVNGDGLYTNLAWITSDQRTYTVELLWLEGTEPAGRVRERRTVRGSFAELLPQVQEEVRRMLQRQAAQGNAAGMDWDGSPQQVEEWLYQVMQVWDFDSEEPMRFCFYDNRTEAWGPGGPPEHAVRADAPMGVSFCRNKRLLRVLERLASGGGDGLGCRRFVRPPDVLNMEYGGRSFRLTLARAPAGEARKPAASAARSVTGGNAAKALALMRNKPYVGKLEVAEQLKLTMRQTCYLLNHMVEDGLLKCLIPNSLYRLEADVYCPPRLGGVHPMALTYDVPKPKKTASGKK